MNWHGHASARLGIRWAIVARVPSFKSLAQSSNDGAGLRAVYAATAYGYGVGWGQGSREIIASRERFSATQHLPDTLNMISTIGSSVRLR